MKGVLSMPSFFSNNLIAEMRARKQWSQEQAMYDNESYADIISSANLSRIENMHQAPNLKSTKSLLGSMKMPRESLIVPHLENPTPHMLQQRDELNFYLFHAADHRSAYLQALDIMRQMESTGSFEQGINRQFILRCKSALGEIAGNPPSEILELVKKGMAITYPEYDEETFEGDMLIFDEARLLLTKAQAYKRRGDLPAATKLLERIAAGLNRLPQDDRDKEQMFTPVLLTLAQCYMEAGEYEKALDICNVGYNTAVKRNKGFYLPDFVHHRVLCLAHLGRKNELTILARQAYFGYAMQRRYSKAVGFLDSARGEFKLPIETYGVEAIQLPLPRPEFAHAGHEACETFGELLDRFRIQAGLSMDQLREGICAKSSLSNIINSKQQGSPYVLEALMERLGRDVNKYINTFLGAKDFCNKQKRDNANALIANFEFSKGGKLLMELEGEKHFTKYIGKQFLELGHARIRARNMTDGPEYIQMLENIIRMTNKKFDLRRVATMRLTYHEVVAVNMIANSLYRTGEMQRCMRLQEALIDSMDTYYVDGAAKMRVYTTLLYNYTKNLDLVGQYNESLPLIDKGEDFSLLYGQFKPLPGYAANRAYCLFRTGEKEKSLAYHALACYGSELIGRHDNANLTRNEVAEDLKIHFD